MNQKLKYIANSLAGSNRKRIRLVVLLVVLAVVIFFITSDHGLIKSIRLESEKAELAENIKHELSIRDSLKSAIKKLKYDSLEIERIAREKYGMIKDGEKVYIFKEKTEEKE